MKIERTLLQLQPAASLEDIYKTLSPKPLAHRDELEAFYGMDANGVRGGDLASRIALQLRRAASAPGQWYRAFISGHTGVGKTTELFRLASRPDLNRSFQPVFFTASTLNPLDLDAYDVLLLMLERVMAQTALPIAEGGAGAKPDAAMLKKVYLWLAEETATITAVAGSTAGSSVESEIGADTVWGLIFKLVVKNRAGISQAQERKTEIKEYKFRRLEELLGLANELMRDCNRLLRESTGQQWLLIGDDFEKPEIPAAVTREIFIAHGRIFNEFDGNLIVSLPLELLLAEDRWKLPFNDERKLTMPDIPVTRNDGSIHVEGCRAVQEILGLRVLNDLFATGVEAEIIAKSGGSLRDLFYIVGTAADEALLDPNPPSRIEVRHAEIALNRRRAEYQELMGDSSAGEHLITAEQKIQRLLALHNREAGAEFMSTTLFALLRLRLVQRVLEANGEPRLTVHPLVLDILREEGKL